MCSFHQWFYDDRIGYVAECRDCRNIQIGYGNVQVTISSMEFASFWRYVNSIETEDIPGNNWNAKTIVLKTPYEGFSLLFSRSELKDLQYMVDQADNERKATQLMKLFETRD
jgi:hypothetical protein